MHGRRRAHSADRTAGVILAVDPAARHPEGGGPGAGRRGGSGGLVGGRLEGLTGRQDLQGLGLGLADLPDADTQALGSGLQ